MGALITKAETAELLGRSTRWVELHAEGLGARPVGTASNGRQVMAYDLSSLPKDAQLVYEERQRQKVVSIAPGQLAAALVLPEGQNLSTEDRSEMERRFAAIEPLVNPRKYEALHALYRRRKDLIASICSQYGVSERTVYNWLVAWEERGLPGLISRDRSDKGKPRQMNGAALDFLVAASLPRAGAYGDLTVREIFRAYNEERAWRAAHLDRRLGEFERQKYGRYLDAAGQLAAEALLPEVSYETLRQWVSRVPEVLRVMARDGMEVFSATQEIISFRAIAEVKPLDYVVMDHRRLDLFAMLRQRGGWKLGRPWLTAAIDMRTRKWLAWVIVETPSSASIAAVLKRCFIEHGLPAALYWDNGKDFRCHWLEGRQEKSRQVGAVRDLDPTMRGVLETLQIRVHHAIVKRARAKLIEPNFLNTSLYDRSTPWWCGHKPTERPERFDQLVERHEAWLRGELAEPVFPTIEQIAADYDDLLRGLNEREHTGEGMQKITPAGRGWMCPNECWEREIAKVQRRSVPAEVLHLCFAKRKALTVRQGELRTTHDGRSYHYRPIGNGVGLMPYNGREVEFAYDPLDLGTAAVYAESRFLGLVESVELRRMGEDTFIEDERQRREARRELRKAINAAHRAVHVPDQRERAARREAVLPVRSAVPRVEISVAVPAALVEAAQAAAEDKTFDFDAAARSGVEVIKAPVTQTGQDDDPEATEFRFFSR